MVSLCSFILHGSLCSLIYLISVSFLLLCRLPVPLLSFVYLRLSLTQLGTKSFISQNQTLQDMSICQQLKYNPKQVSIILCMLCVDITLTSVVCRYCESRQWNALFYFRLSTLMTLLRKWWRREQQTNPLNQRDGQ